MKFFFVTLLNFAVSWVNIFLSPINLLVSNAFPSFSTWVANFTNLINTYLGSGLSWFLAILPPNAKSLVLLYLSLLVICYTITFAIHIILKIIELLRHIKIW